MVHALKRCCAGQSHTKDKMKSRALNQRELTALRLWPRILVTWCDVGPGLSQPDQRDNPLLRSFPVVKPA